MQRMTYDIVDAGGRNRFSVNGRIVHNCTGSGPQPTNFPNSGPEMIECQCGRHHGQHRSHCPWCGAQSSARKVEWNPAAVEDVLEIVASRSLALVEMFFGDAMAAVSGCLRGLFVAKPGHDLVCSDYSAIEAVGLAMLAGEQWRIDVFRTHGLIYETSGARVMGLTFDEVVAGGKSHAARKKGKINELALGYGGWVGALKAFGAPGTEEELAADAKAWRNASPAVVDLWGGQSRNWKPELFGVEGAAIQAVQFPGQEFYCKLKSPVAAARHISFQVRDDILYCKLLSGRNLTYHRPRLTPSTRRRGEMSLSYEGYNTNPKSGPPGWIRIDTYGPKMVENIDQAVCRDIQAHGLINLEKRGYPIVLHVYDENIAEVPVELGSVEEFEAIMMDLPDWCKDWPVKATGGWRRPRYGK